MIIDVQLPFNKNFQAIWILLVARSAQGTPVTPHRIFPVPGFT